MSQCGKEGIQTVPSARKSTLKSVKEFPLQKSTLSRAGKHTHLLGTKVHQGLEQTVTVGSRS